MRDGTTTALVAASAFRAAGSGHDDGLHSCADRGDGRCRSPGSEHSTRLAAGLRGRRPDRLRPGHVGLDGGPVRPRWRGRARHRFTGEIGRPRPVPARPQPDDVGRVLHSARHGDRYGLAVVVRLVPGVLHVRAHRDPRCRRTASAQSVRRRLRGVPAARSALDSATHRVGAEPNQPGSRPSTARGRGTGASRTRPGSTRSPSAPAPPPSGAVPGRRRATAPARCRGSAAAG